MRMLPSLSDPKVATCLAPLPGTSHTSHFRGYVDTVHAPEPGPWRDTMDVRTLSGKSCETMLSSTLPPHTHTPCRVCRFSRVWMSGGVYGGLWGYGVLEGKERVSCSGMLWVRSTACGYNLGRARGGAGSYRGRVWRGVLVLGDGRGGIYCPVPIVQCSSKFTSSSPQAHLQVHLLLARKRPSMEWIPIVHLGVHHFPLCAGPPISSQLFATTHSLPPSPPSPPSPALQRR